MSETETLVRRAFRAYETGDRAEIEAVIGEPFCFTSPQDDGIDREAYFARCWPFHELKPGIELERVFVNGHEAFVTYVGTTGEKRFRNTEFFRVREGKIASVDVYFGRTL
jgi:ketosteroid isomerase-like protein